MCFRMKILCSQVCNACQRRENVVAKRRKLIVIQEPEEIKKKMTQKDRKKEEERLKERYQKKVHEIWKNRIRRRNVRFSNIYVKNL